MTDESKLTVTKPRTGWDATGSTFRAQATAAYHTGMLFVAVMKT